jgi:L-ribulose-5-phosphate 3-epimerase
MATFTLSILTDEISHDLAHALAVAAGEFKMTQVDLRAMWNKNIMRLDANEVAEARKLLERHKLRVAAIASPLFKTDWADAPRSPHSPPARDQFGADFTFAQQDEVLDRSLELARAFNTTMVRCFDFWRLEDQAPHRAPMDERLRKAADTAAKRGVTLALENEHTCNTATGTEAARLLNAVRHASLKLTWDPGNAEFFGESPYPNGYGRLPKDRIAHVHCKDVVRVDGKPAWMAMGKGVIDWVGQFRALNQDGFKGAASLETHWRGAPTPEESSRQSLAGLRSLLARAGASSEIR